MLCNECGKNEAIFHRKVTVNGMMNEEHLCEECLAKRNNSTTGFAEMVGFPEIFTGISNFLGTSFMKPVIERGAKCGVCGTTSDEFQKTAFLGCDNCYNDLGDYIYPLVKRVQYGLKHKGKTPNGTSNTSKYNMLDRELKRAVAEERYEDAARLKKEIAKLSEEDK